MECRICRRDKDDLSVVGVCTACHDELGIPIPGQPLRPQVPCPRCRGTSFVRSWAIRERGETAIALDAQDTTVLRPLGLAFAPGLRTNVFTGKHTASAMTATTLGILEAYACRTCGFTELYTHGAGKLPIGPEYGTELFEVPVPDPYR